MTVMNLPGGADFIRSIRQQGYTQDHAEYIAAVMNGERQPEDPVIKAELHAAAEMIQPGRPAPDIAPAELRAYAAENGLKCSPRGRIPAAVVEHWQQSQGGKSQSRRRRR